MLKGYSTNPLSIVMKFVINGDLASYLEKNPNIEFKQVKTKILRIKNKNNSKNNIN
jgi:hypothetical protein